MPPLGGSYPPIKDSFDPAESFSIILSLMECWKILSFNILWNGYIHDKFEKADFLILKDAPTHHLLQANDFEAARKTPSALPV